MCVPVHEKRLGSERGKVMRRLRQGIVVGLLAATSCAGSRGPAIGIETAPAALVTPGFYAVGGSPGCTEAWGAIAFLPEHGQSLVAAGGAMRRVALERQADGRHAIAGTVCVLTFQRNDLGALGLP